MLKDPKASTPLSTSQFSKATTTMAAAAVPASLLLDRFVSASSAEDAQTSLERILEALQSNSTSSKTAGGGQDESTGKMTPEDIWSDPEVLTAFRYVLRTGNHKHHNAEVPVEEGASMVCKIFLEMIEQDPKSPLLEKDESLVESLIDVVSNDGAEGEEAISTPMYTRVLALQLLTKLCAKRPSKAQAQLLQAPNGLHRLGDLLQVNQEEIIRNEALLLAPVIAEWPSCAKIWMFSGVADQVMLLAVEEGGLTGGNLLVQDCLDLLFNLWKHDPNNLADLVFQSPTLTNNLPRLLDLRQGTEFLNPPKKKETVKKDDDLDDILKSASSKESESKKDETVIPRLTEAEEKIVFRMLDILALLLESENLKKSVWSQQMGLCSLIWELALVSPPPPQVPFVCAVPSASLQQKALERIALYFNDPASMERHAGLDRLLYLVCTGGLGSNLKERMGISQAALHVIRKTISKDTASEMLMNTLAPPISMDEDGEDRNQSPPPTVVHKLLNTVAENLFVTEGIDPERRKIFLAGALGGLSIFFMDQTSREVMLRITTRSSIPDAGDEEEEETPDGPSSTTNTSLVETILLAISTLEEAQNPADAFLSMTLLRFLCHWTIDTPLVVQAILSSNQSSILLSALVGIKTKNESHKKGVAVLGKLLMGLCMEYMGEDEGRCGGWTRASIMELITKKSGGVSKYTRSLEQFKSVRDFGGTMPWSVCELEFKFWSQWYSDCVLLVRKRVVQELTGSGGEEDEGSSEKDSSTNGSARSLQKLVFQQSQEIDELQQSLRKANEKIETQQSELSTYKRRVESAPSQLDNMLTEFSAKTSELESKVKELEAEKTAIEEKHKSELKDREDRIASLQKELEESQAREKESRDETETLREEIDSLSQAYTSLEQEYRQQQTQISSGAPSEQQAGDQGQEGPQDQPNTQHGGGSTAISALRAENERLRSDAQAADQWMTMAVEKMKGLDEQNATLQTELANLRASQSNSTTEQQQQLQQQYHALFEENQQRVQQQHQLQAQLENAVKDTKQLQQVLDQERAKYVELQQHQLQTQEELQNALATMEENKTEVSTSEAEFQRKIAALEGDLEDATAEIFRLRDEMASQQQGQVVSKEQESVLASKNAELGELRQMLEEQSSRLDAENGALQKEIEVARSELDKTQRREQEEIYKKEARIRELEARISGGSGGGYTEEDIKSRDEEISELRAANEAAQEWMSKAVEHHRNLSQRHAAVTAENACLSSQIRDLQTKVADNETYVSRAYVLEQETSMQARQLREAQLSLAASEEEVKRLKEELSQAHSQANSLVSTSDELQRLREEVSCMETSLQEQVATCEQLRSELNAQTESKDAALEELETMKNDNEQLAAEAERLRKEIQILRSEEQLGSTEDKQQFSELNSQLQKLEKTNAQLKRSQKEDKMTMDQLKAEVDSLRSAKETMVSGSLAHEVTTSAEDVFGTVSIGGQSGVAADPSSSTSSAQQVFSSGPPADLSAPSQGAQMHGVSTSTTYHNAQQVTAHELFGSGSTPAMGPSSSAPGAQDIFGSRPSVGRSSGALSAHDVFGSRPATISAHDVFGAGPGALAPQAATAHDVFGSGEASGALDQTSISTAPGGSESQPAISTGEDVSRELETELAEKNHAVQELESKLKTLSAELNEAKKKIAEDETAVSAWEGTLDHMLFYPCSMFVVLLRAK